MFADALHNAKIVGFFFIIDKKKDSKYIHNTQHPNLYSFALLLAIYRCMSKIILLYSTVAVQYTDSALALMFVSFTGLMNLLGIR